jgi:hypothetical protein
MARLNTNTLLDNNYTFNEENATMLDTYFPELSTYTNTTDTLDTQYQTMITQSMSCECCACKQLSKMITTKIMTQQDINNYYQTYNHENLNHNSCTCIQSVTCQLRNY